MAPGTGGVGKAFLSQLKSLKTQFPSVNLAAITTSKRSVVASESDSWIELQDDTQQKGLDPNQILAMCQKLKSPAKAVVVDNTSNQAVADAYPAFLSAGVSVVTPNKKAFSGPWQLWDDIQRAAWSPHNHAGGFVYHESSCGAGLPIISTLNDLILSGDKVISIEGVFSGTMSFLFNSFASVNGAGGKWSAEVSKAKNLGYTEPDPRDDLNGLDVARKLVILARIAGLQVSDTSAFPVQSLIPEALKDCKSGEEFMQRLPEFDEQMEAVKADAEKQGRVVRFVGSIDVPAKSLKVGLEQFAKDHPVANLKGADNIISFRTERYSNTPLIIQGAGAGADVTAMGVTADLIKVFQRLSPVA